MRNEHVHSIPRPWVSSYNIITIIMDVGGRQARQREQVMQLMEHARNTKHPLRST